MAIASKCPLPSEVLIAFILDAVRQSMRRYGFVSTAGSNAAQLGLCLQHCQGSVPKMRFNKPPLVELIAELRWLPAGVIASPDDPQNIQIPASLLTLNAADADALFMRFAGVIFGEGFVNTERLVPAGFPPIPFQPTYRYSRTGAKPGEPMFQLGSGIFSAHITAPYQSWDEFHPIVKTGVESLLKARAESEKSASFTSAMVRYLDLFTEAHTGGRPVEKFLRDVLGIDVRLPAALTKCVAPGKSVTPSLQLSIPLTDDRQMTITLASGKLGSASGIVMDSHAGVRAAIAPTVQEVMQVLEEVHQIVSDTFVQLTSALHTVMEPRA